MDRTTYKKTTMIYTKIFDTVPLEYVEQEAILGLLKDIPLEKLKKIVNLKHEYCYPETISINCSITI